MEEYITMRYVDEIVDDFVSKRFVLLCGPRQVGKTSAAQFWLQQHPGQYLNWDIDTDRTQILRAGFAKNPPAIHLVLDELHKYTRWKSWLKGLYDAHPQRLKVIVTGSARLDLYQRGGDSLLGRYDLIRLHPFSIGELMGNKIPRPPMNWLAHGYREAASDLWPALSTFGGFPAPFTSQNFEEYTRWAARRRSQIIREDLRDIAAVRSVSLIEQLALMLPERVGSPLSINSIRENLQVAHDTANNWIEMLERLYYCYRLKPFNKKIAKSLTKERKLYLWDWAEIDDPGSRFENMVASHLLKAIHAWNDKGYGEFDLQYWRDTNKREVDFVITNKRKPVVLLEAKVSDTSLSPSLLYLHDYLGAEVPMIQLVETRGIYQVGTSHAIISADCFFSALP